MWLTCQPILNKCDRLRTLSRGLQILLQAPEAFKVCDVNSDYINQTPGIISAYLNIEWLAGGIIQCKYLLLWPTMLYKLIFG